MQQLSFPLFSTFLALPLENEAKRQFQALQEELKPYEKVLRFQSPGSPHLTLQFWKEVMEIEFHQIKEQAQKIASSAQPFVMHVTAAETFGDRGLDRVLFLEVAFSDELARLKKSCPWPEGKPFSPHVTLARMRHPQSFRVKKKKIMKMLENISFAIPVDRLRLYAEVNGMKQTPLEDFDFGA